MGPAQGRGTLVSGLPASDGKAVFETASAIWSWASMAENVWEIVLLNFNAIDHVATLLLNLGRVEGRSRNMLLWGEGATPGVVNAIEAVDGELLALREALGLANRRRYQDYLAEQGFVDGVRTTLYETLHASTLATGTFPCGPEAAVALPDRGRPLRPGPCLVDRGGYPGHRRPDRTGLRRDQDGLAGGGADPHRVGPGGSGHRGAPASGRGGLVVDLRISGGTLVTVDHQHRVLREDVYVDRGRIVAVGGPKRGARRTLDVSGMLVMPGMINLHDHLRNLAPGIRLGEGMKLDALPRRFWELGRSAGPDEYRVGAALLTAKLLKSGVTSVVDHLYTFHQPGLAGASVQGYSWASRTHAGRPGTGASR